MEGMLPFVFGVLLTLALTDTASTTVSLSSSLEGNDHGGGACPGEVVVFTCVVSSTVIDWRVPSLDITAVRTGGTLYKTITVGPFEFNGTSLINDTLTSTATVDASEVADNTQIICVDGNSESSVNETSVLRSVGRPSTPTLFLNESAIVMDSSDVWNVEFEWQSLEAEFVSCYTITIDSGSSTEHCNTNSAVFELQLNTPYRFTISAANCGDQRGESSDPFLLHLRVPDAPMLSTTSLTYNMTATGGREELVLITLRWTPVDSTADIADNIDGSIRGYRIFGSGIAPVDVPISSCINNTCSYGIDTFTNESLTEGYIISVAARNAVGLGEESSTMSQSFRNDFVTVELQSSDGDIMCSVLVTCVQFSNSYEVEVNPGMKRASLNCAGGTESNVVIVLNDFDPSIVYKYRVTTESIGDVVEVTVQGTFTAGCTEVPISSSSSSDSDVGVAVGASVGGVILIVIVAVLVAVMVVCSRVKRGDIYEVPVTAEEIAQASKHEIGHGRTYRIRLRRRTYALKKLHIISRVDRQVLQDSITEIVNKQKLVRYRGLVLPLDFVHHETDSPVPSIYVIMPYVKGASLRALIDDGAISDSKKEYIARKVSSALRYLHTSNMLRPAVTHQDLKPNNIIVKDIDDSEPKVRLVEVGISRLRTLTGAKSVTTSYYRAPEVDDERNWYNIYRTPADIYSLGCVLIELFGAQRLPRDWPQGVDREQAPTLLQTYWELCEQCHFSDPEKRPDINEVIDTLKSKNKT